MSAILSSTFWLLLNTPMVPPERTAKNNVVPMVDLNPAASSHKRRRSTSTVNSSASSRRSSSETDGGQVPGAA
ncbi:hypothetical protein PYCCODRAFT_1435482 [Trametes coccinea BRFM310]|uniref:Uncharacterized protein n=1 Tax=Trametes coccinea (strain BRFM310) TaxID=1353009 RepID=A0A1Y2IN03_TRAC3|nr:hypothetical protein PYCCODRAFT_1435482 [Trametes coccinea BRFM310]